MGLDAVIRAGIAVAKKIVPQTPVTHKPWTGIDTHRKPTYGAAVTRDALVEQSTKQIRRTDGTTTQARIKLTFLSAVAVDPRDSITLSGGATGPILDVTPGLLDPTSGNYITEVFIG